MICLLYSVVVIDVGDALATDLALAIIVQDDALCCVVVADAATADKSRRLSTQREDNHHPRGITPGMQKVESLYNTATY